MSRYTIIDTDTHVTETPDVWTSRAPAKMKDLVPRIETDSDGIMRWWVGGLKTLVHPGGTAAAGGNGIKAFPRTYEEMHPAAYDGPARLRYMDQLGIWAMVLYPNVGGFGGQEFAHIAEVEVRNACVSMYNDWITEFASADPRRLLPNVSIPFWDVEASVKEIHRCAKMGHKGILFTGEPQSLGQPVLGNPHWDPIWQAAVEVDLPIAFHIGTGDFREGVPQEKIKHYGLAPALTEFGCSMVMKNSLILMDLLMSGVLIRHPKIRFVSVESGIGWIPFTLDLLDYLFVGNQVAQDNPGFTMLPSEYFRRNVHACFWFEEAPGRLIEKIGADNVMFETDFPHPVSLYDETVPATIETGLADCPADVRHKVLWSNAAKLYNISEPTAADERKLLELS
jgi:predicted TIM-barrel fold metal-dependent hydrolase